MPVKDDDQCHLEAMKLLDLHPDGQPWKKCCGSNTENCCAFRHATEKAPPVFMKYMQRNGKSRAEASWGKDFNQFRPNTHHQGVFVCIHQQEDGYNRVCAGFATLKKVGKIK